MSYTKDVESLVAIFGEPSPPEIIGTYRLYTKIKRTLVGYRPLVKDGFWGRWKPIGWRYFNEQPGLGLTQCRASQSGFLFDRPTLTQAEELINDYILYRGVGITIW